MRVPRRAALALSAVAVTGALAGCGGDDAEQTDTEPADTGVIAPDGGSPGAPDPENPGFPGLDPSPGVPGDVEPTG